MTTQHKQKFLQIIIKNYLKKMMILLLFSNFILLSTAYSSKKNSSLKTKIETLYSSHFILSPKGIPEVTVNIMDSQRKLTFSFPSGGIAKLYSKNHPPKIVRLLPRKQYHIHIKNPVPAKIRYWLSPFKTHYHAKKQWNLYLKKWQQLGVQLQSKIIGTIFALNGRLLDNRMKIAIYNASFHKQQAQKKAHLESIKYNVPIHLHEEIIQFPHATLILKRKYQQWLAHDLIELSSNHQNIHIKHVEHGRGYHWHGYKNRSFSDTIIVTPDRNGKITVINRLPLPKLLKGVLPAEMPYTAPLEALKAQAICARNEILAKIGTRHLADPYLFCARTHCQVYSGTNAHRYKTNKAIYQTRGQVMIHSHHRLVDASYSAVCGGHTENNENVWHNPPNPNTRGKLDLIHSQYTNFSPLHINRWLQHSPKAYCNTRKTRNRNKFRWQRRYPSFKLNALINKHYKIGNIKNIKILKRGVSGRIYSIYLQGNKGSTLIHGELNIRRSFGGLLSSMFIIQPHYFQNDVISWTFFGGGWGHGVGLCQYGAIGRARVGQHYKYILHHYFSKMTISHIY